MLKRRALFALKIHLLYTTIAKCVYSHGQKSIYWLHTQTHSQSVEHNIRINLKRNSRLSFSVGWIKFAILLSETDEDNASCVYLTTTSLFLRLTIYTYLHWVVPYYSPSSLSKDYYALLYIWWIHNWVFDCMMKIKFYAEIINEWLSATKSRTHDILDNYLNFIFWKKWIFFEYVMDSIFWWNHSFFIRPFNSFKLIARN